jgi:serine/threonine protein kinase
MRGHPAFWAPARIGIAICAMVLGRGFVHFHGGVHRALTPSSDLISRSRALLDDFGSIRFKRDETALAGVEVTLYYVTSDLFVGYAEWTPKVDV